MASPQTEKGYTRIANEILENITKVNLNGTQLRMIMVLWRYTYGFRRKEYEIPLSLFAEKVNTTKGHVDRELTALIERKIISVVGFGKRRGRILRFNKNYEEWSDRPVNQIEEPAPPSKKVKPKKEAKGKYPEDSSYYRMALYFHKLVSKVAKDAGVEHLIAKANLQSWADDFRKLVELDKVDKQLAKDVMDWVTQDPFWRTNVLSAKKLREKFTDLAIKMKSQSTPKQSPVQPQRDIRDKEIEFQRWMQEGNDPDAFNWRN
ncbi:replication protein [Cytobacillus oceanisediminis]|uniref:replication protein n=1 Tax=Cytobacillus oceanisediminis TaxID=665099 RepID=UPI00203D817C|nr:replication protein [Cytobacillus oceanisediminis]MCM3242717.1 replication protein [Cytobacillus oceanisediminis]